MLWLSYQIDHSGAFTEIGCIVLDICFIIIISMYFIAICIDRKGEEMKRKKRPEKILYECAAGMVTLEYSTDLIWVYERIKGRLIKCFEVPTLEEGVRYLKSL